MAAQTEFAFCVSYGVATVSRIDKAIGLFCKISSLLLGSLAKEIYSFIDPTDHSHPIPAHAGCTVPWLICCARIHTTGWLHKLNSHPTSATSSYNETSGLVGVGAGSERLGSSQRDWRQRLCFITEGNCIRTYSQNAYAHSHI